MDAVLQEIKNELNEMRKQMATKEDITNMATKEDLSKLATKADVADIQLIKQAVLESRQELAAVKETVDDMKIDIHELKENDIRFEEILLHQRKLIDLLTIKTSDHEAQLKWVR
ncbi:hypothetical protein [Sporosarcina sp. FSL K6-3457]|uniref:hypothetical protein n=1 Tax=Sporosarcina sp. FSL K6-3457 TaxID=2978204 RepID=UPI0030FA02F0